MKHTIHPHRHARRALNGFTLIEFMGVLLLASVAIFLVLRQQQSAGIRSAAENVTRSLSFMQQKAGKVYNPNFAGLSCSTLANNGAFAGTSFRVDKSSGATKVFYDGEPTSEITCAAANLFGTNDSYRITIPNLSDDLCSELVDQISPLAWVITVNGTSVKPARGTLNVETLGTQCTADATSDAQSVILTLARQVAPK